MKILSSLIIFLLVSCSGDLKSDKDKTEHHFPWTGFSIMEDGSYEYINYRYATKEECLTKTRWTVIVNPDNDGKYIPLPLNEGDPLPKMRKYGEEANYGCAYRSNSLLKAIYYYAIHHHEAFECLFETYDPHDIYSDYGKYKPILLDQDMRYKHGECKF